MKNIRDDELLIEREFDAPATLVFRLWEDRDHMLRWWGPEEFTTIELDWELTPGRPWRGAMTSKQYGLSRFGGVIREVERNRRIVFTFRWDDDPEQYLDTVATMTLAEKDGKTVQTFHQALFSTVAIRDSHIGGWNSLFNKQQIYVENIAVAEREGLHT
ncbi:SRPBCC domain-containing protein [Mesorhizobium sp. LHD-90]|uniref:SRPBCC family protein n=1 Tax=Mesorhizobium sp. LHD-90 TaxID=3071414 RepID=UPI0027E1F48F|nr:SRPBCC domain-containing protein [Mesorhizobium sp. LHD-90]MDQ6438204.1 SRPBCC domain-containing protein [Mesorhizobium sp. LHD-90]